MLHNDLLVFKPYPDVIWNNLAVCLIMALAFMFLGAGSAEILKIIGAVSVLIFIWAVLKYVTTVTVTSVGVGVKRWKYESVPMTAWNQFSRAYILDVSWTVPGRFRATNYAAYYLLLTRREPRGDELLELGRNLAGKYPCGNWHGHVALRLNEYHMAVVRECIGQAIPIVDKCIERDESIRL